MTDVTQAFFLTPPQFDHYWPDIEAALDEKPELWNTDYTKDGIRSGILNETMQAWVISEDEKIRVVFMTQRFVSQKNELTLYIFWLYGSGLPRLLPSVVEALRSFAIKLECTKVLITGRKGFERLLKPYGMEYKYSVYGCDVVAQKGN